MKLVLHVIACVSCLGLSFELQSYTHSCHSCLDILKCLWLVFEIKFPPSVLAFCLYLCLWVADTHLLMPSRIPCAVLVISLSLCFYPFTIPEHLYLPSGTKVP